MMNIGVKLKLNKIDSLVSVCIGSSLQWYDFALFGTFAPIMAKTFFPENMINSLLFSFLVFYLSFVLMPFGGFFFGWLGDKFGRKKVLSITILLMAIPTMIIGVTPSYGMIGYYATILVIISRILQGLVASPEFANSAVYLVEIAPKNLRSLYGCLTGSSYSIGFTLGGLVGSLLLTINYSNLWRVAFLISSFGAFLFFFLRQKLPESPYFLKRKTSINFKQLKKNMRAGICTLMLGSTQSVLAYGSYVWMVSFLHIWGGD